MKRPRGRGSWMVAGLRAQIEKYNNKVNRPGGHCGCEGEGPLPILQYIRICIYIYVYVYIVYIYSIYIVYI